MIHRLNYLWVFPVFLLLLSAVGASAADSGGNDLAFLDGLSLVVVDTEDVSSLHVARRMVQSYGGTVAIMSPPSLLVGWVPFEAREALLGKAGIREIYYTEVFPGEIQSSDPRTVSMVSFYNSAVRGDLAVEFEEASRASAPGPPPTTRAPDVFTPEPIDQESYLENLRSAGLDPELLSRHGILPDPSSAATTGNSDFMTGTVALTLFFVESDGTGSDPDLYTWTAKSMQTYLNNVATALAWWSNQARGRADCWVTFLINYYSGADPRCQQWVEPILHDQSYEDIWVTEIMTNFGYTSGSRFTRVTAFNTWQRSYYQTHRSYSAFIPYNPPPAASFFPGGGTAYAYWYGPYTVLLFRVQGWTTAQVFAHESGHIFGACDEYAGGCGSYSCGSICANNTLNGNCEACNPNSRDCMMKANSFSLCSYTTRHVGWEVNTPCAPSEPSLLPAPALASVSPAYGGHGTVLDVTVTGSHLYPGIELDMGSDVFVHAITLTGGTAINARIEISGSAPPGPRDVRVINPDGQHTTLDDAFEVRLTTRHYYSPGGGNQVPYVSPTGAATTLEDAIKATYDGDTLFVVSGQFDEFSLYVDRGVFLYGGWNETFTERDLVAGKTILSLGGNVTFQSAAGGAGLDGFVLFGGPGPGDIVPFTAIFGGAIRFIGGAAIVSNCEIHSCSAGGADVYGVGGAIFANGCTVDIRNNTIHDNSATQGGAIYLRGCTGSVSNNTISGNAVYSVFQPAVGAGIALIGASDITLSANTITANTDASEGGGLYIESSAGVVVTGGTMRDNPASFSGGGISVTTSTVVIDGVELRNNTSEVLGGGLCSIDSSNVTIIGAAFFENSARFGGGVFASARDLAMRHCLLVRNTATSTAAAAMIWSETSGEIAGNTLVANTSPAVGGMVLECPEVEVYNNIITGCTGTALSINGSPPDLLAYNLIWDNSGGDYAGCTPGAGSLSSDPLFVDPAADDYHVGLNSPVIDAGRPGTAYEDPDGSRGDMGIFGSRDFEMDQPSYPKNLTTSRSDSLVVLEWHSNPEPDIAEYAVYGDLTADFLPGPATLITLVAGADSGVTVELPADSLYYRISAVDADGYAGGYSDAVLYSPTTTAVTPPESYVFALRQNVPNPFNPSTRIAYELPARTPVELTIYDVNGRLVRRLVDDAQGPGSFTVTWEGRNDDGRPVASGVYFYRLSTASGVKTRKMVLLK